MNLKVLAISFAVIRGVTADLYNPGAFIFGSGIDYDLGSSTLPNGNGDGAGLALGILPFVPSASILTVDDFGGTIGIGHIWYETPDATIIDRSYVLSTDPFYSIYDLSNTSGEIQMQLNQPFIIGFWLDGKIDNTPGAGDVYGWAKLMYDGTTLHLLDSAAENSGAGIIAGRYEVVPEPSSVLLLGVGAGGILFYRRSKRRQQEQQISRRNFK